MEFFFLPYCYEMYVIFFDLGAVQKCGILNISQPYRPPRPIMGIAFIFFTFIGAQCKM
jgi:hypothetical protein